MIPVITLWHYWQARRLRFTQREVLEAHQRRQLKLFARRVLANSPYFRPYRAVPIGEWPQMDKTIMMANFDRMNTAGLSLQELLACARRSEVDRDFTPKVGKYSVGLSTGTSGRQGIFVVSPQEQQIWAGGMLAKMLPQGLLAGEKVVLFLRADNNLYHSVNNRWLSLIFYDLFAPFADHLRQIEQDQPSIVVAPAQVLCALARAIERGDLRLQVKKVISCAEVLEPQDRQLLKQVFTEVGEVYQATEGFLAATCSHGTLHLNEEFIHVEPQWIDERRFNPVITDFTRRTQPIVRYRLDDVLVHRLQPCPCGQATIALEGIEGRSDDQLLLPVREGAPRVIFADLCRRAIANALPAIADYRLIQHGGRRLQLIADCLPDELTGCQAQLISLFEQHGIASEQLEWQLHTQAIMPQFDTKRRRIMRVPGGR